MIKENKIPFDKMHLDIWDRAGYRGKGATVVVLDDAEPPREWDNVETPFDNHKPTKTGHKASVCSVVRAIAPEARIIALNYQGGSKKAVDWVLEHQDEIDIVTISIGGPIRVHDALLPLEHTNIIVMAAAGNATGGSSPEGYKKLDYPANFDWTLAVGAAVYNKSLGKIYSAGYSKWGERLNILAFTGIYLRTKYEDRFTPFTGTSGASPTAAGLLARYIGLMKTNGVNITKEDKFYFIHSNCEDMYEDGKDIKSGYGLFVLPSEIPVVDVEVPKEDDNMAGKDFFTDDDGRWSEEFNNELAELGILKGDGKGNFRPTDVVTREELSKVAVLLRRKILAEIRGE